MSVSPRLSRALTLAALSVIASTWGAGGASAQDENRYRVGLTVGGTSAIGVTLEYQLEDVAFELTVGTMSFRDLSLSLAAKHYIGGGAVHPYVGAGLWSVIAFPPEEEKRTGWVTILRVPLGLEWNVAGPHSFGLEANLNRALAVKRPDPEDTRGPQKRIVPLPAFYYRWASE